MLVAGYADLYFIVENYKLLFRHWISALNAWAYYTTTHPIANSFLAMDARVTSQLNVALNRKVCGSFFDT